MSIETQERDGGGVGGGFPLAWHKKGKEQNNVGFQIQN